MKSDPFLKKKLYRNMEVGTNFHNNIQVKDSLSSGLMVTVGLERRSISV